VQQQHGTSDALVHVVHPQPVELRVAGLERKVGNAVETIARGA